MRLRIFLSICVLYSSSLALAQEQSVQCESGISSEAKKNLARYIQRKYNLPDSVPVSVVKDALLGGTC